MEQKAKSSPPEEAAEYLEYLVNYYPSGTKQLAGSKLDRIVESARSHAIKAVIDGLRSTTGKDLGDDPKSWWTALRKRRDK
jgi:hypothetical protein